MFTIDCASEFSFNINNSELKIQKRAEFIAAQKIQGYNQAQHEIVQLNSFVPPPPVYEEGDDGLQGPPTESQSDNQLTPITAANQDLAPAVVPISATNPDHASAEAIQSGAATEARVATSAREAT